MDWNGAQDVQPTVAEKLFTAPSNNESLDMPQPLSRVCPNASYTIDITENNSLASRPEHALLIAQCIGAISEADHICGLILACMLGADAHVALAMYDSPNSASMKRGLLNAAADVSLDAQDREILCALSRETKASFNERNDFAHSRWGISDELPDAILMVPARGYTDYVDNKSSSHAFALASLVDRNRVMVYRKNDLENSLKAAQRTAKLYGMFRHHLFYIRHSEGLDAHDSQFEHLRKVVRELDQAHDLQFQQLKNELRIS